MVKLSNTENRILAIIGYLWMCFLIYKGLLYLSIEQILIIGILIMISLKVFGKWLIW